MAIFSLPTPPTLSQRHYGAIPSVLTCTGTTRNVITDGLFDTDAQRSCKSCSVIILSSQTIAVEPSKISFFRIGKVKRENPREQFLEALY